jgi:hypothetical protein
MSSNTRSGGFGVTLHHASQTDQDPITSSASSGTGNPGEETIQKATENQQEHHGANKSAEKGTLNEDDIKNKKP